MSDYPDEVTVDGVTYVGPPDQGYGTVAYSLGRRCENILQQEAHCLSDKQRIVIAHQALQAAVTALGLEGETISVRGDLLEAARALENAYRRILDRK